MVSETTTATRRPVSARSRSRSARAEASGSSGQQGDLVPAHVARVDPGRGEHQAVAVLGDDGRPAAGDDADRLVGDGLLADRLAVGTGRHGDETALGLAEHLAGDDEDVAVLEVDRPARVRRRRRRAAPRAVPRRRSPVPRTASGTREVQGGPRHRGGRVEVGHQQRHGAHGSRRGRSRRRRPCRPASRRAARPRSGRRSGGRRPRRWSRRRSRSGTRRPCRAPARRRRSGTARRRSWAASASRMPGTCRTVPMLTTGLLGGSTTTSAAAIASRTPGAGAACSAPTRTSAVRGQGGAVLDPPLLEVDGPRSPSVVDHDVGLGAVVGHRQQRRAGLPAGAQRAVTSDSGKPRVEHLPAHQVGREVAVAEAEPRGGHVVGEQLLLGAEASRPAGPSRAPRRCRRRGCT